MAKSRWISLLQVDSDTESLSVVHCAVSTVSLDIESMDESQQCCVEVV